MSDPFVRSVGEVRDIDDVTVTVGVDYDTVSVKVGAAEARLASAALVKLAGLLLDAGWQAAASLSHPAYDPFGTQA